MANSKTTYDQAKSEFDRMGFITPQNFTKGQLNEILDVTEAGSPFEAEVVRALRYYE